MHEEDSDSLFADGFDSCIIGLDMKTSVVVYDYYKIINLLISHGMSQEEALEYAEYNILGAYVGEKTPIFINVVQNNLKEI
jgi:hypothetical protein